MDKFCEKNIDSPDSVQNPPGEMADVQGETYKGRWGKLLSRLKV